MNLTNFYKNKRVLITGHTGFKGTWLTQILLYFGAKICGYSLKPKTNPSFFQSLKIESEIDHHIGDIRDLENLNKKVIKFQPDIIFHLAAQPIVRDSYDNPKYTYDVNIMGTINILETIRFNHVKAGVIVTTDKVYKNKEKNIAYQEDDSLGGYDPYSNSKACADLIVSSYIDSYFNVRDFKVGHKTLIASARAGNVIGGGDWSKDRLMTDAIRAFFEKKETLVIRNPKAIRPFQHVFEPLHGYLMLAQQLYGRDTKAVGAWNFGPEDDDMQSVERVIKKLIKILGDGSYIAKADKTKHEANMLKLDSTKAKRQLKWSPKYNLNTALLKTAHWYQEFYTNKSNINKFTLDQIKQYFS